MKQKHINIWTIIMLLLFSGCLGQSKEEKFLAKYEFEDFSQFKGVKMFFRSSDEQGNFIVLGYAPHFVNDSSNAGYYIVKLDKKRSSNRNKMDTNKSLCC